GVPARLPLMGNERTWLIWAGMSAIHVVVDPRPTGILQAQNFSNLPHRQSLGGHRTSNCVTRKSRTLPRSDCRQRPPSHPINRVAAFVRIGWPLSIGIGGRLPSESMAALPRIPPRCLASKGTVGLPSISD